MALSRIELNLNGGIADITEDDGSDASTSDLAIVYDEVSITNKQDFVEHLEILMRGIEQVRVKTELSAGHSRWHMPRGGDVSDVLFETAGSFSAMDPSGSPVENVAIELLPAATNINAQDRQAIFETLETLIRFVYQNDFPR